MLRDLLYLAWIIVCPGLVRTANRTPVLATPVIERATAQPGGCVIVLVLFALALAGAGIGASVPHLIAEQLPHRNAFGQVMDTNVDVLGRLAQVVGGVCGFYIALRAIWLWCVIGTVVGGICLLNSAVNYVTGGPLR